MRGLGAAVVMVSSALSVACLALDSVDEDKGSGGAVGTGGSAADGGISGAAGWAPGSGGGGAGGAGASGGSAGAAAGAGVGGAPAGGGGSAATGGAGAAGGAGGTGGTASCQSNAECSDQNACNGTEKCSSGACAPGVAPSLDDGNSCTTDTCDPMNGVTHQSDGKTAKAQCITSTPGSDSCPAGYYREKFYCDYPSCPTSQFGVNAMSCAPACLSQVVVCCSAANCPCPSGYSKTGSGSDSCGCTTKSLLTTTCTRN